MSGVDYRVLGSLEALRAGRPLPLGGAKQRAVLAILVLRANQVVTTDELIEALWPESPPGKPRTAIQGYVSQLRTTLDPERPFEAIITEPAGYRLPTGPEDVDLVRLESFLRQGREALDDGHTDVAARTLREALSLFRGPPLADFGYESWAQVEIGRLTELRLACLEERIEADLRLGRHAEVIGELEAQIAQHPLRERLRAHLMLALYRAGRQSEALAAYQDARRVLVEEFGIEPAPTLQELERRMLRQDSSLALEVSSSPVVEPEANAPVSERSILIIIGSALSAEPMIQVAVSLARSHVPHELIVAELVEAAGRSTVELGESLGRATTELHELRADLRSRASPLVWRRSPLPLSQTTSSASRRNRQLTSYCSNARASSWRAGGSTPSSRSCSRTRSAMSPYACP